MGIRKAGEQDLRGWCRRTSGPFTSPVDYAEFAGLAVLLGNYPDVAIDRIFVLLDSIARLIGDGNHASEAVFVVEARSGMGDRRRSSS